MYYINYYTKNTIIYQTQNMLDNNECNMVLWIQKLHNLLHFHKKLVSSTFLGSPLQYQYNIVFCSDMKTVNTSSMIAFMTRTVLRLAWPFDGIVQKHIHKRLI